MWRCAHKLLKLAVGADYTVTTSPPHPESFPKFMKLRIINFRPRCSLLSVWGQLILFVILTFMPDLACY